MLLVNGGGGHLHARSALGLEVVRDGFGIRELTKRVMGSLLHGIGTSTKCFSHACLIWHLHFSVRRENDAFEAYIVVRVGHGVFRGGW